MKNSSTHQEAKDITRDGELSAVREFIGNESKTEEFFKDKEDSSLTIEELFNQFENQHYKHRTELSPEDMGQEDEVKKEAQNMEGLFRDFEEENIKEVEMLPEDNNQKNEVKKEVQDIEELFEEFEDKTTKEEIRKVEPVPKIKKSEEKVIEPIKPEELNMPANLIDHIKDPELITKGRITPNREVKTEKRERLDARRGPDKFSLQDSISDSLEGRSIFKGVIAVLSIGLVAAGIYSVKDHALELYKDYTAKPAREIFYSSVNGRDLDFDGNPDHRITYHAGDYRLHMTKFNTNNEDSVVQVSEGNSLELRAATDQDASNFSDLDSRMMVYGFGQLYMDLHNKKAVIEKTYSPINKNKVTGARVIGTHSDGTEYTIMRLRLDSENQLTVLEYANLPSEGEGSVELLLGEGKEVAYIGEAQKAYLKCMKQAKEDYNAIPTDAARLNPPPLTEEEIKRRAEMNTARQDIQLTDEHGQPIKIDDL
jgi:hypothetical protein